ncbi:hypothetical protein EMWEY_00050490, partial [Eimeria maxima]
MRRALGGVRTPGRWGGGNSGKDAAAGAGAGESSPEQQQQQQQQEGSVQSSGSDGSNEQQQQQQQGSSHNRSVSSSMHSPKGSRVRAHHKPQEGGPGEGEYDSKMWSLVPVKKTSELRENSPTADKSVMGGLFSTRKPKDAGAGLSSGLKSVGKGVAAGAVSLVLLPAVGASQ